MSSTRLMGVSTFTRYGQRNPYPMPVTHWNVTGDGQLTEAGKQMLKRLGEKIREHYADQFFSNNQTPDVISKSSTIARCPESAKNTLEGLAPGAGLEVKPDPVFRFDFVNPPEYFLSSYKQTYAKLIASLAPPKSAQKDATFKDPFKSENVAVNDGPIDQFLLNLMLHCDNVRVSVNLKRPLPDIATPEIIGEINDFLDKIMEAETRVPGLIRKEVERIVTQITKDLSAAADEGRKLIEVINSHDAEIDWILLSLYFRPDMFSFTPATTTLTFELHEDVKTKERLIKIYYMRDLESFPGELIRSGRLNGLMVELKTIPETF